MLTLYHVLTEPVEEILARANQGETGPRIELLPLTPKHYKHLLARTEIVLGHRFTLRDGSYVRIIEVDESKNHVKVCLDQLPYCQRVIRFHSLSKESEITEFPYYVGVKYWYKKNQHAEPVQVVAEYLNPAQKAIGILVNGKKKYIKVCKIYPVTKEETTNES